MNNVSSVVESQFKTLSSQFLSLMQQSANIYKAYTATDVSTLVGALANNNTPATVSTALNKYQYTAGITFCVQLANFFNGASVTSADYYGISEGLTNGDTPAGSPLSAAVELIGSQLFQLGQNALTFYAGAVIANGAYNQNGLAQTVTALVGTNSGIVVPGCSSSCGDMANAITMVLQFLNLMTNQSVFASNYFNTCIQWTQM